MAVVWSGPARRQTSWNDFSGVDQKRPGPSRGGVDGPLQRVFQRAERLLQSGLTVELRKRRDAELQPHIQHVQ